MGTAVRSHRLTRRLAGALVAAALAATGVATGGVPAAAAAAGSSAPPPAPALSVTGASLTVAGTGQQLYGDRADARLLIASTTKLMTALVVLQHVHRLGTVFTQTSFTPQTIDSQIGLAPGERMSVHDLLIALMLPSADDAAIDLAYNVGGGSIARFVAMMNAEAVRLGLTNTHYGNPVGFDEADNYSSPYDLTRLAAYDMSYSPFLRRVVALQQATLRSGDRIRHVVNTDTLLGTEPWITGIKTGHTDAAGYILVSSGTQDGLTLIASVLGTPSEAARNASALALLRWGFANFAQATPVAAGTVLARPSITDQSGRAVVVAAAGFSRVLPRADAVRVVLHVPRRLSGPMARGARVGTATVLVAGRPEATLPLALGQAIPAVPVLTRAAHFLSGGLTLLGVALIVCGAIAAWVLRRRRPRAYPSRRLERG